jgi:hypothetical protein
MFGLQGCHGFGSLLAITYNTGQGRTSLSKAPFPIILIPEKRMSIGNLWGSRSFKPGCAPAKEISSS